MKYVLQITELVAKTSEEREEEKRQKDPRYNPSAYTTDENDGFKIRRVLSVELTAEEFQRVKKSVVEVM